MISQHLLTPFQLGGLTLKNRIVLAPMTRSRAGKDRLANTLMAEYYAQRSSAGLLISEATTISVQANGWNESPGIYTEDMRDAWKQVTDAVHAKEHPFFCSCGTWEGRHTAAFTTASCPLHPRQSRSMAMASIHRLASSLTKCPMH